MNKLTVGVAGLFLLIIAVTFQGGRALIIGLQDGLAALTTKPVLIDDTSKQQSLPDVTVGALQIGSDVERLGDYQESNSEIAPQQTNAVHNGTFRDPYDTASWRLKPIEPQHNGRFRDPYGTASWGSSTLKEPQHNGSYRDPYDTALWGSDSLAQPQHTGSFRDPYDTASWSTPEVNTPQHNGSFRDPYDAASWNN